MAEKKVTGSDKSKSDKKDHGKFIRKDSERGIIKESYDKPSSVEKKKTPSVGTGSGGPKKK